MSRPKGSWNAGVRLSPEGEWELRCPSCADKSVARYWPLTVDGRVSFEFWSPKYGMSRCRACWMERKAVRNRERWRSDPAWREAKLAANREQERARARFAYAERWAALRADPVKYEAYKAEKRERQRIASANYRARQRERVAA
jgi:hypothetical protein